MNVIPFPLDRIPKCPMKTYIRVGQKWAAEHGVTEAIFAIKATRNKVPKQLHHQLEETLKETANV